MQPWQWEPLLPHPVPSWAASAVQERKPMGKLNGKCWLEAASTSALGSQGCLQKMLHPAVLKSPHRAANTRVLRMVVSDCWQSCGAAAAQAPAGTSHDMCCCRSQDAKWTLTAAVASGLIIVSTSKQVCLCFTSKCICSCCAEVRRWVQIHRAQSNHDGACFSFYKMACQVHVYKQITV